MSGRTTAAPDSTWIINSIYESIIVFFGDSLTPSHGIPRKYEGLKMLKKEGKITDAVIP